MTDLLEQPPDDGGSFAMTYLAETAEIARRLDAPKLDAMALRLARVREAGGRLFILGAGGGAGHASHAVNDFRKICDLESYAPSDNVSELTAWINDAGWDVAYARWLAGSRLGPKDAILIFSVGGGSREHGVSLSLVGAIDLAREVGATVLGVVGRHDGETARHADLCLVIDPVPDERRTPHVEAFQAVAWHLLVSHPALARRSGTWEAIESAAAAKASG
jgi:D-sedoheptulose 7-phosphate isomerase